MAEVDDSILNVTKKILGLPPEQTAFDLEIITHINSMFTVLEQLGIGKPGGFFITDNTAKWSEFMEGEAINAVKSYMGLRVRLLFDPPTTGPATDAINKQAEMLEWRLHTLMEGVRYEAWLATQPTSSSDTMGSPV
ncbi:hypothetical protein PBI_LINDA_6 [Arthrobacter phage Linda]|nr:hypothetical protein PBI_LINDA_6 [Arthrobacter phage Linda]